uniref:RING-type domain-containing protein n=1 Tax=Sphaeramia orbicularis TaxID=375764 RepID=A0A673BBJ0_9TELE
MCGVKLLDLGLMGNVLLLQQVEAAHGDSADVCSIWHVDADAMPDWIHSAVHQAQWTLGKLNCPSCGARLGGFNFVHGGECPCGRDAAVHLSKSRVDRDHKHYVLIVQPRRTRPLAVQPGPPMDRIPDLNRAVPLNPGLQLDCAANRTLTPHIFNIEQTLTYRDTGTVCILVDCLHVFPLQRQTSSTSNRLNKREKNRLKSLRRKQRRRERWLHRQLDWSDADDADREGVTCAVCLDVYFSPYTCRPCDHVFCEPCLRTLAKNRHANTPCPLCRTLITHTSFNKELHHAAKTFFPKVYVSRKQNFQNAPCSKWPLPSCRKRFRNLWGEKSAAGGRWRLTPAVFMLDALDLTDMRGWLFDIALVIVYIHSVNWILAALLFGFLTYYFLC